MSTIRDDGSDDEGPEGMPRAEARAWVSNECALRREAKAGPLDFLFWSG